MSTYYTANIVLSNRIWLSTKQNLFLLYSVGENRQTLSGNDEFKRKKWSRETVWPDGANGILGVAFEYWLRRSYMRKICLGWKSCTWKGLYGKTRKKFCMTSVERVRGIRWEFREFRELRGGWSQSTLADRMKNLSFCPE